MNLELVTVQYVKNAPSFDWHDGFTAHWWNRPVRDEARYQYIQVLRDGIEVARVQLDETVGISYYEGTPDLGDAALEVQFIEVSDKYRLQGIGAAVVRRLAQRHPERRLVAFSEGADEFWSKLGWGPHFRPVERGPRGRTLFIQPG